MRAEIKDVLSPDVIGLESWRPDRASFFGVFLQVLVSESGGGGSESFGFMVCSPEWLQAKIENDGIVLGRHYLFLAEFDYQRVLAKIESIVRSATGSSWEEIALKIARHGSWEFEDYSPYVGDDSNLNKE